MICWYCGIEYQWELMTIRVEKFNLTSQLVMACPFDDEFMNISVKRVGLHGIRDKTE